MTVQRREQPRKIEFHSRLTTAAQHGELPGEPGVPINPVLPGQARQTARLNKVAIVALNDVQLQVEPAQTNQTHHLVETGGRAPGFPSRHRRLLGASSRGQLGLGEPGPAPSLTDELPAIRTHT
nr:hypothetical protein [Mycolicibacterium hodleri]